jgi:signal transduction protein with GAF and PtsI domain
MIFFGDQIDRTLGVTLGVSTLAAAGMGNMIADVMGIGLGGVVARFANRLGLPTATLTLEQTNLRSVRWARQVGCTIGVMIGCFIGMFPLLWMDHRATEKRKRKQRIERLMGTAVQYISDVVDGESASLFVLDEDKNELWTVASKELNRDVRIPLEKSLAGRCARLGLPLLIEDVYQDPDFNSAVDTDRGTRTRNIICAPIFGTNLITGTSQVIGVVEVINKRHGKKFTLDDERVLANMGGHIAIAIETIESEEDEIDEATRFLESLKVAEVHHAKSLRFASENVGLVGQQQQQQQQNLLNPTKNSNHHNNN